MRRTLLSLAAALMLAAAWAAPATAITKTSVKDFAHPFVGLVAFYDANGEFMWRCTGELLSETVVLTAGHCTDKTPDADGKVINNARIWFQQDAGVQLRPCHAARPDHGVSG